MDLNVFCGIAVGLSVLLVVAGAVIAGKMHRSEMKDGGLMANRRVLSPFQVFVLCFFCAAVVAFFPVLYFAFLADEAGVLKAIKSIMLSVHTVLRSFVLDGDFSDIQLFITGAEGLNAALAAIYSVYMCLVMLTAPLVTASFVLSFFRDASAMLRYGLKPCKYLYVMSELNDCSLALAGNILTAEDRPKGTVVVFTDILDTDKEGVSELVYAAKRLGAICVKKDITEIGLKFFRKCTRKLYFIGMNEDENIGQAIKLISRHAYEDGPLNTDKTEMYVFSNSAESEALLNSIDNGKIKVRRVNENRNLVLQQLRLHPIYDTALPVPKEKWEKTRTVDDVGPTRTIRLAIIGLGGYGTELLRAVCWCGQMPGFELEVHVYDIGDGKEKMRAIAPDLVGESGKKAEGEAQYTIEFHDKCDVKSKAFSDSIASVGALTGVYVTLGDDEQNIETAISVRVALGRTHRPLPPIYAVVYSASKSDVVESGGLVNMEGTSYGITFIGALRDRYTVENIEQAELEASARELHLVWANKVEDAEERKHKIEEDTAKFDHYEYYRRSSMAQAVYRQLRTELHFMRMKEDTPVGQATNDMLRVYEHRRWNAYMRGEGYTKGKPKDHIAKVHPSLVPYDELSDDEKPKDDF